MKYVVVASFVMLSGLGASGCAPPSQSTLLRGPKLNSVQPKPTTADVPLSPDTEAWRAVAPAAEAARAFVPPPIARATLSNGIDVLLVERHDLPLVNVQVLALHGADDTPARIGSLAMAALLASHSSGQLPTLREQFESLAVTASFWSAMDSVGATLECTESNLAPALTVVGQALQHPRIDANGLSEARAQEQASFARSKESLASVQGWAVLDALYPALHPYRGVSVDRARDIQVVRETEIAQFYASHLTPHHAIISVAGDATMATLQPVLEKAFGQWRGTALQRQAPPKSARPPRADEARAFLVDRRGVAQTHIAVVAPSLPRSSPDWAAATVLNAILGGSPSSRVNHNLREEKGLTYGVGSWFSARRGGGEWTIGGAVTRDKAGLAIRELLREIGRMIDEPVRADELAAAKSGLIEGFPATFETLRSLIWMLGEAPVQELPMNQWETRAADFSNVTAVEIQRVALKYLNKDRLRIVATGDAAVVRNDLEDLQWGPVRMLEPAASSAQR